MYECEKKYLWNINIFFLERHRFPRSGNCFFDLLGGRIWIHPMVQCTSTFRKQWLGRFQYVLFFHGDGKGRITRNIGIRTANVRIWQIGFLIIVNVTVTLRFVRLFVGFECITILQNSRPNLRKFRVIIDRLKSSTSSVLLLVLGEWIWRDLLQKFWDTENWNQ